ncbi:MAG: transcriptional regulator, MerR family [Paenibacillus sp.]|nr:transcriptional regulator, MerR family [Paenibacillus sp.]
MDTCRSETGNGFKTKEKEGICIYKIEDVAKMVGLTKRTLRYYEELGLLPPPSRSEGGFRLYTDSHVERLNNLKNAREVLGFSLQELLQFVTISEQFTNQRDEIKQTENPELRLQKIEAIEQNVATQLALLDQKLEKITEMRAQIGQLYDKVVEAKTRIMNEQP